MTTTITSGPDSTTPDIVNGYESVRTGQTVFHTVIGRDYPDVTLRPAGLRSGTLRLVYGSSDAEVQSANAEALHAAGAVYTLTTDDLGSIGMMYVVNGNVTRTLDPDSLSVWILAVDFQEVQS